MGLTASSTGIAAAEEMLFVKKKNKDDKIIAVSGNPNVGKSTLFNALTGLKQHTGNWPGKTVSNAQGYFKSENGSYVLVDIPGTYSLFAHSPEEEIARNFICFSDCDTVIVVCDATCLERNLNLVLQTAETGKNVIVCINLLDEAKKKGISIDIKKLSDILGVKVVGTVAKKKKSLKALIDLLDGESTTGTPFKVRYSDIIEQAISAVEKALENKDIKGLCRRWLAVNLLQGDISVLCEAEKYLGFSLENDPDISLAVEKAHKNLRKNGVRDKITEDFIASSIVYAAEKIARQVVTLKRKDYNKTDRKIDSILTSKKYGYPIMVLLLALVFWITVTGANYVSDLLSYLFTFIEKGLNSILLHFRAPKLIKDIVIEGIFRVPAWVISVMLPPMAIFFPFFTLLEDAGYLPRIAFNLDKPFKRCGSCGKQALTMCMGLGCNAAGVVGTRIIDSKRERLLSVITNSMVPCNGRFPAIIAIITMFFVPLGTASAGVVSALILTAVILLAVFMTFVCTKLLSSTVLKGYPSSYILEMPSYRKPQIGQVLVRSVFDRTLFVLGRSLTVAIPAGFLIWLSANLKIGDISVLSAVSDFLDPLGRTLGLDGVILIAFILGFPANEIVMPIILMAYLSAKNLGSLPELSRVYEIFTANGWTVKTALCTVVFSLFHWPCSTTVLTIKKETESLKWTLVSLVFPTLVGAVICLVINFVCNIFA